MSYNLHTHCLSLQNSLIAWHIITVYLHLRNTVTCHVSYQNIKAIDPAEFAKLICSKKICMCAPVTTDAFANELDASVTRVLGVLAPLRSQGG